MLLPFFSGFLVGVSCLGIRLIKAVVLFAFVMWVDLGAVIGLFGISAAKARLLPELREMTALLLCQVRLRGVSHKLETVPLTASRLFET